MAQTETILVSVIIPVYNGADYLRPCLDSVLSQTLRQIEIICVDDGSTDDTPAILQEYAGRDPRVTVLTQANAGAGPARNNGLFHAKGQYLSFLDADDCFDKDMLEKAWRNASDRSLDVVIFTADYLYRDGSRGPLNALRRELLPACPEPFAGADIPQDAFRMAVGWAWDKLFRRDFITSLAIGFEALGSSNDLTFVFTALAAAKRIGTMNGGALVHHRTDITSISSTREHTWNCWYQALTALRGNLVRLQLWERFERDFLNYCVYFAFWQLTTVRGDAYGRMYCALQSEWADELGLRTADEKQFYTADAWQRLQRMLTLSQTDFLLQEYHLAEQQRDQASLALNSRAYRAVRMITGLPDKIRRTLNSK